MLLNRSADSALCDTSRQFVLAYSVPANRHRDFGKHPRLKEFHGLDRLVPLIKESKSEMEGTDPSIGRMHSLQLGVKARIGLMKGQSLNTRIGRECGHRKRN